MFNRLVKFNVYGVQKWTVLAAMALSLSCWGQIPTGSSLNLDVSGLLFEPGPNDPTVADCWGYTSSDGRQYGLISVRRGTAIIDVTDIENPAEVAFITGTSSLWHDVKVYKDYAYAVSDVEGSPQGLQIINLSVLPGGEPQVVKSITSNGIGKIHNIHINEETGLMFLVNEASDGGVFILNLEPDPQNPQYISRLPVGTHDAYSRGDTLVLSTGNGRNVRMYKLNFNSEQNLVAPQQIASFAAPGMGYSHNNWMTKDGRHLLTTEEVPGRTVKAWDISNLGSPSVVGEYLAHNSYIAHQVFILGDIAFVAHYGMGVRFLDISDPGNMEEIAWHRPEEISPTQNDGFDGTWGMYVFPTGKVIHSHNPGSGLYVLQLSQEIIEKAGLPGAGVSVEGKSNLFSELRILNAQGSVIEFNLSEAGHYLLQLYTHSGQKVSQIRRFGGAGITALSLDEKNLTKGNYVLKLSQGFNSTSSQLIYTK